MQLKQTAQTLLTDVKHYWKKRRREGTCLLKKLPHTALAELALISL